MYIAKDGILIDSLVNGPGVRLVVFAQGCSIGCKGCHNPDLQKVDRSYTFYSTEIQQHLSTLTTGITISGGEPLDQFFDCLTLLVIAKNLGLTTMVYTGRTMEQLMAMPKIYLLLQNVDFLKIGPFIEDQLNLSKPYCGSDNQKVYRVTPQILDYGADGTKIIKERELIEITDGGSIRDGKDNPCK